MISWYPELCLVIINPVLGICSYYLDLCITVKNSKWVWSGNTTITNCRQTCGIVRKSHITIAGHQEDKQSKAISSLFPIKMIAKLELTQSNAQQNTEQPQKSTMGVRINIELTTTEPLPQKGQQQSHWGAKCTRLAPTLAHDSAVVKAQKC